MFYEERLIDATLCYRSTPDGEWLPRGNHSLTLQIFAQEKKINDLEDQNAELLDALKLVTFELREGRGERGLTCGYFEPFQRAMKVIGRAEGKSTFGFDWMDVLNDYHPEERSLT